MYAFGENDFSTLTRCLWSVNG